MNISQHITSYTKRHKIGICIMAVVFFVDLIYLSNTTSNVPIMDYWRYGDEFLYEIFNGGIRFDTFWESINGQRGFLTYLLFFINVKFFHWNTRVAIFFGSFVTFLTGLLLLYIMDSNAKGQGRKAKILEGAIVTGVSMLLFNYIQWEIKVIEFAAPFAVITFFVVLNMWLGDYILNHLDIGYGKIFGYAVLLGLSICFIYSAFFPAVVGAIGLCGMFHFFVQFKKDGFSYIGAYLIVGAGILLAAGFYLAGIQGISGSDFNLVEFGKSILDGEFFKGYAVYLGTTVLHALFSEKFGIRVTGLAGCAVALFYLISIWIYLKHREQIKSYFPVMLIVYSLLAGVLLSYGRGNVYGVAYMASSRYAFQSKMGLIGVLLIFKSVLKADGQQIARWRYVLNAAAAGCVIGALLASQAAEFKLSPYRRANYDALIETMHHIDSKEDDELEGFQANTPEQVRNTVEYMKMYRLGVFANLPPDGRYDGTGREAHGD